MAHGPLIERPDPERRARRIAGALFFATCCSVFVVNLPRWSEGSVLSDPSAFERSIVFTLTLMTILLAHEMGHYAMARRHGFRLTLPWFLPAPFLVGTLGAIIRLQERPRTRTGLLEMGAAGPLAGLGVVILALSLRFLLGDSVAPESGDYALSRPLLWWVVVPLVTGEAPPPVSMQDPVVFAAWIGCLLTAMNLLPFGQLDGGHVISALTPEWASTTGWILTGLLLAAGLWWPGWAVWAGLLHLLGARHAVGARSPKESPSRRANWIAAACAIAFLLTFTPIPVQLR